MTTNGKLIKEIINSKAQNPGDIEFAKNCMIELCNLCDTQKRLTKLTDLFENLTDGVLILDSDLNFIDANKLGAFIRNNFEVFNYQGTDYELLELPFIITETKLNDKIFNNASSTVTAISNQGFERIFNISSSIIYSEAAEPAGICVVINDATELQKQAMQLEDMMASFSHDLKTPLIAAEVNLKHLLEGSYGEISDNQKKIFELMLLSNENALNLVQNLLRIFKYETQSYRLLTRSVKIQVLFQKALATLEPLIKERELSVEFNDFDTNKIIQCDPFEIERVITNILTNAIKFSAKGLKIEIDILYKNQFLIVSVRDYGIGIAEDKMINLFNRFWQSKQHAPNTHGTGLGLYLAKKIIDAHGGKIWAESKEGEGTSVIFQLPITIEDNNE